MNSLIILAHPAKDSFNHAIADACIETLKLLNHNVIYHDLYEEHFDPILDASEISEKNNVKEDIKQYCEELINADNIIFIHPNWWGQPPAILKGWIDRVVRSGLAYKFLEGDNGEGIPIGLLKCKKAFVFNTSNTNIEREKSVFGDPLERIWKDCILKYCGIEDVKRRMFETIAVSSENQRKIWLSVVEEILQICI
ncbi:MAG: NAD(P)H-dependent oxidoreductase [Phocaeicola sp.]